MECWNCKQLTDAFLAVNPRRKAFVKCEVCIEEMKKNGVVFIDLPYQPERSKREDRYIGGYFPPPWNQMNIPKKQKDGLLSKRNKEKIRNITDAVL